MKIERKVVNFVFDKKDNTLADTIDYLREIYTELDENFDCYENEPIEINDYAYDSEEVVGCFDMVIKILDELLAIKNDGDN